MKTFQIDVSVAGDTLWVNSEFGECLGRFSKKFGIDVHRSVIKQLRGMNQCLFCTHGPAGPEEWKLFQAAMLKHHNIIVPPHYITY